MAMIWHLKASHGPSGSYILKYIGCTELRGVLRTVLGTVYLNHVGTWNIGSQPMSWRIGGACLTWPI